MYTCLMYHEIVNPSISKFSVDPTCFIEQVKCLKRAGVTSYILGNDIKTTKSCLLTFDDGHGSNLDAARLLAEEGYVGYFYLVKDYSELRDDYLKENEIKEISSLGHIIGVHGKNHQGWVRKDDDTLIKELRETKDWIEQLIGEPIITCSAPGGLIDNRVINCIKRELPELKYIRTSRYGINHEGDTVLNSIGIRYDYSVNKVRRLALNNPIEMGKIMTYYYAKEIAKSFVRIVK